MKSIGRRALMRRGAATVAALGSGACLGTGRAVDDGLEADPDGILDLLPGFSYRVIQRVGEVMSDGYRVAGWPDAMGCFEGPSGTWILMRNHELMPSQAALAAYPPGSGLTPPAQAVDPARYGGVSRVVIEPQGLRVRSSNLVLAGTERNCAGGVSPWGWLSCEETDVAGHGYCYVCPIDASEVQPARRIDGYGRYRHEAAAVHESGHVAYLSEDQTDGAFYRFVPVDPAQPFEGRLQAMRVDGRPGVDTSAMRRGGRYAIDWVDIADPTPAQDTVRLQAVGAGGAVVSRGEGLWIDGDELFLCATSGGPGARGQVFRLQVRGAAEGPESIEVVADASSGGQLDMPDNLTVSPRGHLYVAEDGFGGNYLRRVDVDGTIRPLARNAASSGELAGPCFSPNGSTLFVNLQQDGLTLAITGPFGEEDAAPPPKVAARDPLGWAPAAGAATGLGLLALAARRRARKRG